MITPISKLADYLVLGNLGEKLVTTIQIDISEWLNEYPDGVLGLSYERPGEPRRYWPASNLSVDYSEKVLTWVVNQHALEIEGVGTLVVRLMSGDSEKRSRQIMTRVNPGHATIGPLPTPMEDYISQLTQLAGDVLLDADRAAQAAEDAEDSVDYIIDSLGQLFKGPYDPAVVYSKPSVVFSTTGSSYAYIGASPASGMPLSDPGYWTLVALKGASIVSAAFANDIITFTKDDGTTVQVTIAGIVAATQAANEAAALAEGKAELAQTATTAANEAAALAEDKAGLAQTAAAAANDKVALLEGFGLSFVGGKLCVEVERT